MNDLSRLDAATPSGAAYAREVMRELVEAGADLRATTPLGATPLHLAAERGHFEFVEALLKAGADRRAAASRGFTPLHVASQGGHSEVTRALVKVGGDLEAKNCSGFTPLHLAACMNEYTIGRHVTAKL